MKMMIITRIGRRRTAITRNNRGELTERGPAVLQKHVLFSLSSFLVFIVVVVVVVMSLFFFHFCFFCMCFFDDDDGFGKQRTKKKRDFS